MYDFFTLTAPSEIMASLLMASVEAEATSASLIEQRSKVKVKQPINNQELERKKNDELK